MATQKPKNFLIFISDEHRKDAMGCVGHPIVKTPNLDALAARGSVVRECLHALPHVRSDTGCHCLWRSCSQNRLLG